MGRSIRRLAYALISLLLIGVFLLLRRNQILEEALDFERTDPLQMKQAAVYGGLFFLCLLCIAKLLPLWLLVIIMITVVFVMDKQTLTKIDYSLLLTFIGFFIFVGNMGRTPFFYDMVQNLLEKSDFLTVIGASQMISNVPAVLLLSGFTHHWDTLLIGSNLGGLGTLIASMASLISYKYLAKEHPEHIKRYLLYFTVANLIFLGANLIGYVVIQ